MPADGATAEQSLLLADSVGLAMLVVLDSLSPAERIAFVGRSPEVSSFGLNREADGIPNAGSKDAQAGTIRVAFENVGAMEFGLVIIRIIDVRS